MSDDLVQQLLQKNAAAYRENDELRAEVERLREIGDATFMAMCAFRDSNDEEAFQDAIDVLGAALRKEPKP